MRKYPVTMIYSKLCTNTTEFPHPNPKEKPLKIEKGTSIVIPVYALQNDEKYYPNPKKFDPDRFLPENKESIPKFTYMPFGDGPRICIGTSKTFSFFSFKQTHLNTSIYIFRS